MKMNAIDSTQQPAVIRRGPSRSCIVRSLVGLPVFKETFGYNRDGKYIIAAKWLSASEILGLTIFMKSPQPMAG
jgi:hypothetical protein